MSDDLRLRMEEAALLPPEDPVRQEVEAAVRAAGPAAAATWADLLRENDVLAAELRRVQVPVGLAARLAALPDRPARRAWRAWVAAAAAAVVLAAVGFGLFGGRGETDPALEVAHLAAANFAHDGHVTEASSDVSELDAALTERLGFDVRLPGLGPDFLLAGGRSCTLGATPVAFSSWDGPGGTCAVYQFPPEQLELPPDLDPRVLHIEAPRADGPCCVVLWAENGRGYAFVTRDESDAHLVARR